MTYTAKLSVFFVGILAYASTAWAIGLALPPELMEKVEFTKCANETGSWKCVVKNKTDKVINMRLYYAIGYDSDGVKIDEGYLSGTIEPGGATKINFASVGYAGNVSKIVIRAR